MYSKILHKTLQRSKKHELGLFLISANYCKGNDALSYIYLKELTEQIKANRQSMIQIFGNEIITDIEALKIRTKKLKPLEISL